MESPDDELWFWMLVTLGGTIVIQMTGFAIAASCKFDTITDILGSSNFIAIAIASFFAGPITFSKIVWNAIFIASRLELGILLLWRVCERKEDKRFDNIRGNCPKFFIFWVLQIAWAWVTSLTIVFINWGDGRDSLPINATARLNVDSLPEGPKTDVMSVVSYVFMACFFLSWALQTQVDLTKYFFVKKRSSRLDFCTAGLWSLSRHPNYFFEIAMWWSMFLGSIPLWARYPGGIVCVLSPLWTMTLLLGMSGIPFAEGQVLKKYYNDPKVADKYHKYWTQTPPVVPFCPGVYQKCPNLLKVVFCCEFPCYKYKRSGELETTRLSGDESMANSDKEPYNAHNTGTETEIIASPTAKGSQSQA